MTSPNVPRHRAMRRRRPLRSAGVGAAIAGLAAMLLLGGQGSLASWRVASTVQAGTLTTGALALTPVTANGTNGCTQWSFTTTGGSSSGTYGSQALQPGDTLVADCKYSLTAKGGNLVGHIAVGSPSTAPPAALNLATSSITLAGSARSTFTSADDGATVKVALTLSVPSSDTSNPSADATYLLHNVTVSAVQDQS